MNIKPSFFLLIFLFLSITLASGQELKILDFKSAITDISAREKQVLDINSEPCAIIKVRTGLINLEFESNKGIESVETKKGEYWIWVSPGTSRLKIILPEFPLFEYELPVETRENEVYLVTVVAILPTRIEYRDQSQTFISFDSEPEGANVFVNDVFQGKSPLKINIPDGTYNYRIEKEKYIPFSDTDSVYADSKGHNIILEYNYKRRHLFFMPVIGLSSPPGGMPIDQTQPTHQQSYGFKVGQLGKTSWYFSTMFSYKNADPDMVYHSTGEVYKPLKDISGKYYVSDLLYDEVINHISISAGVTQQVGKSIFLYAGFGYYYRECYASAERRTYNIDYSLEDQGVPLYEEAWIYMLEESFVGASFEGGLFLRIKKNFLGHLGISQHFEIDGDLIPRSYDLVIGIGYTF